MLLFAFRRPTQYIFQMNGHPAKRGVSAESKKNKHLSALCVSNERSEWAVKFYHNNGL